MFYESPSGVASRIATSDDHKPEKRNPNLKGQSNSQSISNLKLKLQSKTETRKLKKLTETRKLKKTHSRFSFSKADEAAT